MKRQFWVLFLVAVLLGLAQPAWSDTDFYVIGGGRGVGTPITSLPKTINQPGFYYLTGNLTCGAATSAITISANNVTLDLMGFTVTGYAGANGIYITASDVEVRNGVVRGPNKTASGVYSSFQTGGKNVKLANLKAINWNYGIFCDADGISVNGCQADSNVYGFFTSGAYGILLSKNVACYNTTGFYLHSTGVIIDNIASANTTGFDLPGIATTLIDRNSSTNNTTNAWLGKTGCTAGLNTP